MQQMFTDDELQFTAGNDPVSHRIRGGGEDKDPFGRSGQHSSDSRVNVEEEEEEFTIFHMLAATLGQNTCEFNGIGFILGKEN